MPAVPLIPHADKDLRIESLSPHVNNGLILFHQRHTVLNSQVRHWPEADHDDGAGHAAHALDDLRQPSRRHPSNHSRTEEEIMISMRGLVRTLTGWLGKPMATPETDPQRWFGTLFALPNPDPILRNMGQAEQVYFLHHGRPARDRRRALDPRQLPHL